MLVSLVNHNCELILVLSVARLLIMGGVVE